ncbi:MAG: aspartyl/asparaginyl beta-hydroxylase domain-containing protein [Pseudomonadota bacterium]
MTLIVALLLVFSFSIALIRMRNVEHFSLRRQLTNYATFMVPFNLPAYLLSKVPLTHFVDRRHFPELDEVEENWEVIRDEALALYDNGLIAAKDDLPAASFYRDGRWTSFYLKAYGIDIPSAYELAPKTMALLDRVPNMQIALFACLNPGKELSAHHDPFAFSLRYSLGLSTPNSDRSGLVVNAEDYQWRDGESIIADQTYFHSAYNRSDKPRIILMTDVDRPLRWAWVQKIYYAFGWTFNRLFAVDNIDLSRSGLGNKAGRGILAYQKLLKRFKHWNKPLYVASKGVTIGLALFLTARAML